MLKKLNLTKKILFFSFRRNFFEQYRVLDEKVPSPKKFTDCARIFRDCKDAEKYNDTDEEDEEENEEQQQQQQNTTNSIENEISEAEEGAGDSIDKNHTESIENIKVQNKFASGRLDSFKI